MLIDLVAGARPNLVKLAPVRRALEKEPKLDTRIVDTGQHYDANLNADLLEDLELPAPEVQLHVGSGTHGEQTARLMERYERHLLSHRPDLTVVFGDVNSTMACALAAVKLRVPVAHVEAGLRSFDRTMPEEINRVVTDSVADLLLVPESAGLENLRREGVPSDRVELTGNVMVDSLVSQLDRPDPDILQSLDLTPHEYGLVTLHRPSNVDESDTLRRLIVLFTELARELPLVFPMHPRTRRAVQDAGLLETLEGCSEIHCVPPCRYRRIVMLMRHAKLVLTDSGGVQEETSFLRIPCLTLRENTERPVTVEVGTSRLVGSDPDRIRRAWSKAQNGHWPRGAEIPLWDGKAATRVARAIVRWLHDHGAER